MPDLPKPRHAGADQVPRLHRETPAALDSGQGEGYPAEARGPGPAIALLKTGPRHRPVTAPSDDSPQEPGAMTSSVRVNPRVAAKDNSGSNILERLRPSAPGGGTTGVNPRNGEKMAGMAGTAQYQRKR